MTSISEDNKSTTAIDNYMTEFKGLVTNDYASPGLMYIDDIFIPVDLRTASQSHILALKYYAHDISGSNRDIPLKLTNASYEDEMVYTIPIIGSKNLDDMDNHLLDFKDDYSENNYLFASDNSQKLFVRDLNSGIFKKSSVDFSSLKDLFDKKSKQKEFFDLVKHYV